METKANKVGKWTRNGNVEMERGAGGQNWARNGNVKTEKKAKLGQDWKSGNEKEGKSKPETEI